jgi:outer membrane protein OmpA-like peptidoglycan-associated protein/tetratricopeptide (TPR) repeat protein
MYKIQLFILFTLGSLLATAQTQPFTGTKNKKAELLFISALKADQFNDTRNALTSLKRALDMDSNFIDAWMLMADIKEKNDLYDEAIDIYLKVIRLNEAFQIPYYKVGKAALENGKYKAAVNYLKKYLELKGNQIDRDRVDRALKTAQFGLAATEKPVPFDPKNLGPNINTELNEYFPGVTVDEQMLVFTKLHPPYNEDFYVSRKKNGEWSKAENLGHPINTDGNEGSVSLSSDGQYIFYTACQRPQPGDNDQSCNLYFSALDGNTWREPRHLGMPVNTSFWESQPSVSFDGKTLYFSSNRPGGFGMHDLWYSTYSKGRWSAPVNLGPEINTPGSEQSPFIAKDDKTLYFISDYHEGMGGADIFMSRRQPDGRWGKPVNLGYPINTHMDEAGLVVSANGEDAYIVSERKGGFGGLDIYEFKLYEEARPQKTGYVKGVVYDAATLAKLKARIELIDLETAKTIIEASSNRVTGEFLFCLQGNRNYALNVSCEGYLFYSENFALKDQSATEPLMLNVPLNKIIAGEKAVLRNVFFDVDKFDLKPESKIELDKLVALLKANASMRIELSGHTDNTGNKQKNLELSNNRAKAVMQYLISNGIDATRLTFKGYADMQPIADNATEKGRKQNRRTEFKILSL